jgi:hypothetical protein
MLIQATTPDPGRNLSSVQFGAQLASSNPHAEAYNSGAFHPTSVDHPLSLSPNGMSAKDARRQLLGGTHLPSANGMSENTYEKRQNLLSPLKNV